jgi:hypothetical protein
MGDKFPKLIYHSIVCIGVLVAQRQEEHWAVSAVGAPNIGERWESEIVSAFVHKIAEFAPQLVTFIWPDNAMAPADTPKESISATNN